MESVGREGDDVLHLAVIEEETVDGSVATGHETGGKSGDVEARYSFFAEVTTAEEFYGCGGGVGEE